MGKDLFAEQDLFAETILWLGYMTGLFAEKELLCDLGLMAFTLQILSVFPY